MLEHLHRLPSDPLLGLISRYRADERPDKIDLGVGVYRDESGATPVLASVKRAEEWLLSNEDSKVYVGPLGNVDFNHHMHALLLGDHSEKLQARSAVIQTPGGCGALRVIAETIVRAKPDATVWLSNPTWANHEPLLGGTGIRLRHYDYYDYATHSLDFSSMLTSLNDADEGDVVLLHGCCHNPSGADLNKAQWQQVLDLCLNKGLVPLIDMAYQGFGSDIEGDAYGVRLAAETLPEVFVAVSCSKNFGLYRERVGVALILTKTEVAAEVVTSHLKSITRGLYSMPPSHGASVVAAVLGSNELRSQWLDELAEMRERIVLMRSTLASTLALTMDASAFSFVTGEHGMFSFLGIDPEHVKRLATEHGIYMADSSRINVAGLNSTNIDHFCAALTKVLA